MEDVKDDILKKLNVTTLDLIKFCIMIVFPLVTWFMAFRQEVQLNRLTSASNTAKIEYIRAKQDLFNSKMLDKIDSIGSNVSEIGKDVGDVMGQLKRLK